MHNFTKTNSLLRFCSTELTKACMLRGWTTGLKPSPRLCVSAPHRMWSVCVSMHSVWIYRKPDNAGSSCGVVWKCRCISQCFKTQPLRKNQRISLELPVSFPVLSKYYFLFIHRPRPLMLSKTGKKSKCHSYWESEIYLCVFILYSWPMLYPVWKIGPAVFDKQTNKPTTQTQKWPLSWRNNKQSKQIWKVLYTLFTPATA